MKSDLCDPLLLLLILGSSGIVDGLGSVVDISYRHITSTKQKFLFLGFQMFCDSLANNMLSIFWSFFSEFTDLAAFYSPSDVNNVYLKRYHSWIGLHKETTQSSGSDWVWSDGQNYNINWQDNVSNAQGNCAYVTHGDKKIYVTDCGNRLSFTCWAPVVNDVFILEPKTWPEASAYCRSNYRHLVSFSTNYFDNIFFDREIPTWIGLYRDGASWKWSWGDSEYTNWLGQMSVSSDCGSISSLKKTTAPQDCDTPLPSLCIADNLVLVKEKRSWEEALEHCRGLRSSSYSQLHYDLLSLQPADNQHFIKTKVMQADTEEVWTGLRFLAGDWLWVNGADMLYTDLPLCPAPGQHCGILSKSSSSSTQTRDCSEGKNFLCYSYTPVV